MLSKPRKKTATVNFTLRLREDLRRQLAQSAQKENRSLNEEMVHRLEQSFEVATANAILERVYGLLAPDHLVGTPLPLREPPAQQTSRRTKK